MATEKPPHKTRLTDQPTRPHKWMPSKKDIEFIKELLAEFKTEGAIANALGISPNTLYKRKKELPDFAAIFAREHNRREDIAVSKLWRHINDDHSRGQLDAVKWYLTNQHKWGNKSKEAEDDKNPYKGFKVNRIAPKED